MSEIELKSIGEIANPDIHFFIPNYQRGYRWEVQQVEDLLNDILEFQQNGSNGIYCIQPLVVKRGKEYITLTFEKNKADIDDNDKKYILSQDDYQERKGFQYEVIDGQQRLTTIHILLTYLQNDKYSLTYATREGSSYFLNSINASEAKDKKDSNIDFCHMYQAYDTISNWFDRHADIKKIFTKTVLEKVRFIWYETEEPNPIKVFTRLNIGKIPLTDAELVKALFLNESNFSGLSNSNAIRLQQQEIAAEWDRIEFTLQNDEFWLFIHDTEWDKPTRIDFILDLIREKDSLQLKNSWIDNYRKKYPGKEDDAEKEWVKCIGTDKHQTFRYFYEYFTLFKMEIKEGKDKFHLRDDVWRKIKNIFQIFNEWFNDLEMYHYVGFLVETGTEIKDLIDTWQKSCSQDMFLNGEGEPKDFKGLKALIKDKLRNCSDLTKEYELSGSPKQTCRPLLLLFNIQTVINQNLALAESRKYGIGAFYKFPFHLFKMEGRKSNGKGWEIEHIASNAGDELEKLSQQKIYLAEFSYSLGIAENDSLKLSINNFIKSVAPDNFQEIYNECKKRASESHPVPDSLKNYIWNFALLDSSTNEEYHNSPFPIKRICVLAKENGKKATVSLDDQGQLIINDNEHGIAFVPPCTRAVFTKSFTNIPTAMNAWTLYDAKEYLIKIHQVLITFISDQTNKIENFITKSNSLGENK